MAAALTGDPLVLLAFWADASHVHALFLDEVDEATVVVSTLVVDGFYPALSPVRAGASLFERTIHDLWGHTAAGGVDTRPWLDHGFWGQTRPLSS